MFIRRNWLIHLNITPILLLKNLLHQKILLLANRQLHSNDVVVHYGITYTICLFSTICWTTWNYSISSLSELSKLNDLGINNKYQWHIQSLSNASIPVWATKVGAQIKVELMQNNICHLIISSMQMRLHVVRHLTISWRGPLSYRNQSTDLLLLW